MPYKVLQRPLTEQALINMFIDQASIPLLFWDILSVLTKRGTIRQFTYQIRPSQIPRSTVEEFD